MCKIHLVIIVMLFTGNVFGQELDLALLRKFEAHFEQGRSIVLNYPFNFSNCFRPFETIEDEQLPTKTLLSYLRKNPNLKIKLTCHSDCRGSDSYNKALSKKRAQLFKAYLIAEGIDGSRIVADGKGSENPIVDCPKCDCDEQTHRKNRRIEISPL